MSKPLPLPPDRVRELLDLYPHHSDLDLAERFGLTRVQVRNIGIKHGVRKTAATRSASRRRRPNFGATLMGQIEQALAAAGKRGRSVPELQADLPQANEGRLRVGLYKLTALRRAHRIGPKDDGRWFTDEAHADAAEPQRLAATQPVVRVASARTGPAGSSEKPQVTASTRITVGPAVPGPDARWHANAPRHFAALKPGQYDSDAAPSSWVTAITNRGGNT